MKASQDTAAIDSMEAISEKEGESQAAWKRMHYLISPEFAEAVEKRYRDLGFSTKSEYLRSLISGDIPSLRKESVEE